MPAQHVLFLSFTTNAIVQTAEWSWLGWDMIFLSFVAYVVDDECNMYQINWTSNEFIDRSIVAYQLKRSRQRAPAWQVFKSKLKSRFRNGQNVYCKQMKFHFGIRLHFGMRRGAQIEIKLKNEISVESRDYAPSSIGLRRLRLVVGCRCHISTGSLKLNHI